MENGSHISFSVAAFFLQSLSLKTYRMLNQVCFVFFLTCMLGIGNVVDSSTQVAFLKLYLEGDSQAWNGISDGHLT